MNVSKVNNIYTTQQSNTCSKSTIETSIEVKYVQSYQNRHQNDVGVLIWTSVWWAESPQLTSFGILSLTFKYYLANYSSVPSADYEHVFAYAAFSCDISTEIIIFAHSAGSRDIIGVTDLMRKHLNVKPFSGE